GYESQTKRFAPAINMPGQENFGWPPAPVPNRWFSLVMALFPHIEQDGLKRNVVDTVANPHYTNCLGPNSFGAQVVPILICLSDSAMPNPAVGTYTSGGNTYYFGLASYGGCSGTSPTTTNGKQSLQNGIYYTNSSVRITAITDGTSNTIAF